MSEVLEAPAKATRAEKAEKKTLKKWKITFHSGEGENADHSDIEIGHNYKINVYKRNVETVIDENYLNSLKAAVVHTVITNVSTDGLTKTTQSVTIPRFSYTLGEQVE